MALRERDLSVSTPRPRPVLAVVPPPPRRHGVAATGFVVVLAAVLAVPIVSAAREGPPSVPFERPRGLPAASIASLDPLAPVPGGRVPRSGEPVAGIAFVRCTGLWVSEPDGHAPRKLLPMGDISSPAFSSDGRTIAFVRTSGGKQSLWLSAADGTATRKIGAFESSGSPVPAKVTGLAWAPSEPVIAFALTDGTHGPLVGGSAIWTFDLSSGSFDRVATGWPAPAWYGRKLLAARNEEGVADVQVTSVDGAQGFERRNNSAYDDFAFAVVPPSWWHSEVAILRSSPWGLRLALRNGWRDRDKVVAKPPQGYRFAPKGQPTITQDGSRVVVDLLDPGAGRDLGLFDPETRKWTVLDYAWDASASPTPTILGPISRRDARVATEMLFSLWSRHFDRAELLTKGRTPASTFPWKRFGWAIQDPVFESGRWVVPVVAYSYGKHEPYAYRSADVVVRRIDGRLTATPTELGPIVPVTTVDEAHAFAETVLGRSLPSLPPLPYGAGLQGKYALSASSYGGNTQATINMKLPRSGNPWDGNLAFSFGEGIDFSLGCGGPVDPDPIEVNGQPGMADRSEVTNQIIWPATEEEMSGPLSIHGNLSREELIELAEQMGTP